MFDFEGWIIDEHDGRHASLIMSEHYVDWWLGHNTMHSYSTILQHKRNKTFLWTFEKFP